MLKKLLLPLIFAAALLAAPLQAADVKISELPSAASVNDADTSVIVQSGTTKKAAASAWATYINGKLPSCTGTPSAGDISYWTAATTCAFFTPNGSLLLGGSGAAPTNYAGSTVTAGQMPTAISAAGALTGTATPTLGASGTLGTLSFGNATSGLITLQPVAGALGTVTLSLPATTGTVATVSGNLGTPSAVVLTSATGLPLTTGVTGTLPFANGGTTVLFASGANSAVNLAGGGAGTLVSKSVTVAAGDTIRVVLDGTILNNSGSARTYSYTASLGSLTITLTDAATTAASGTARAPRQLEAVFSVSASNLAYQNFYTRGTGGTAAGSTGQNANTLSLYGWQTTTSDITGSQTLTVTATSSDTATTTQTFQVQSYRIEQIATK